MAHRPDQNSAAGPAPVDSTRARPADAAVQSLLGSRPVTRRDGRRTLLGFVAVLAIAVAILNVVLFRQARERAERDGWRRLEASADLRRDGLDSELRAFRREALGTLEDPIIEAALLGVTSSPGARLPADARHEIAQDMERFGFTAVQVADEAGRIIWQTGTAGAGPRATARLVRRALVANRDVLGDPNAARLVVAVPLAAPGQPPHHAVLFHDAGKGLTRQLLARWPGMGESNRAFLVRPDGDRVVVLAGADTANVLGLATGQQLVGTDPLARVAQLATGPREGRMEAPGLDGTPAWVVTRPIPEAGWGLVAVESREDGLRGLDSTWGLLLVLDVGLVLIVAILLFVSRQLYRSGLARREAEITARDAGRMQAVFDTAFDAILLFDRDGRVHGANRAAAKLFDRPVEALQQATLGELLAWTDRGPGAAPPEPGTVASGHARRPDGGEIPVECSFGRSGEGDEMLRTAIARDVRDRVEAERLARESAAGLEHTNRRLEEVNAQLEEASRLKSEFLANTSHELRTPLNGMIGFLQLVLDGLCDSPEEEQDYLRQALACSRHLLGLINDVLDIAKIEAGKLTLEIERLDVQRVFDEVYTLTHVQAAQRGVTLAFVSELAPGAWVRGDFGKVKQVLLNLVGNSLKFTPRGRITVRAFAREPLGHVIFEVLDTGVGIPHDRQKLIFEKFVQADGSTTRRFGGTGLGLAISRSLIELMGGIIGVQSDGEGQGTRMYFSLPLWREESPAAPETAADRIEGVPGGSLVLVVEDDPVSRRLLTAILQRNGYRTVEAENAESAWLLVRRHRPACIVLDYALSCADGATLRTGWDLAQRLTSERDTRHIPLVFVTGFDGELREKLRSTAFARRPEHLVKPIEPRQLLARVEALVGAHADRPLRVLMADDDASVAAYVRKVLSPDRFHIEIVNNGEECLHVLRTQPRAFDLLLLDLMMPEVSGYDVLREMALSSLCPNLPVLVLTNFPEPRDEAERQLLEQGLVIEIVSKTDVHADPGVLPAALQRHLHFAPAAPDESRREAA